MPYRHGERHHNVKLTSAQVDSIRVEYAGGQVNQHELAARYGVSQGTVSYIVTKRTRKCG